MNNIFNYRELFKLEIVHDYYEKGKSADFVVMPTPVCRKLLLNNGLAFKASDNGFTIYADSIVTNNQYKVKRELNKGLKMTFIMQLINPFLLNFSELPTNTLPDTKYYFNNLTKNIGTEDELFLVQKNNGEKYVFSQDQIEFKSGYFSWHYNTLQKQGKAEIKFIDSGFCITQQQNSHENNILFQFDLTKYPSERFDLYIDESKINAVPFYNSSAFKQIPVFGIIEIYYSDHVPSEYLFIDTNQIIGLKKYAIPFHYRKTKWRYIIRNNSKKNLTNPGIIEPEGNFHFTQVKDLIFESDELIPMKEAPLCGICLRNDIDDSSSELISPLPNAPVNMIVQDTETNLIYSNIYVNI